MPLRSPPKLTPSHPAGADRIRNRMIQEQLVNRGIVDTKVLETLLKIPRHLFVDEALASRAYSDATLPIGEGQTLSQPFTVARMTEALELKGREDVLEIGTGSGYQTAVLSKLCRWVFTIERLEKLSLTAQRRLKQMNIHNIIFQIGDGSLGWNNKRTFDRILITAVAPEIPNSLTDQLADNGILVAPEGNMDNQYMIRLYRKNNKIIRENLGQCRFVPLVGAEGWKEAS
ncbi:MAG: protein-L-isoaspartate(D-aspartate) O-methyltransferase [Magnetococcus sp. DMHC-6]